MTEIVPDSTKTSRKGNPQPSARVYHFLTWNNYPDDWKAIFSTGGDMFRRFVIQEEIAPTTGTPHLQGIIQCDRRRRDTEFKLPVQIHWEKMAGSFQEAARYCSKEESRKPGTFPFVKDCIILPKLHIIEPTYPWELEILNLLTCAPDSRKIYWYWESIGNAGKTSFAIYLAHKYGAICLEGKKNDILYCAAENDAPIYIYDIPRSHNANFISYESIEKIKNGFYMSSKYESKCIIRPKPHVFVFANEPPDTSKLSGDRWVIKEIIN